MLKCDKEYIERILGDKEHWIRLCKSWGINNAIENREKAKIQIVKRLNEIRDKRGCTSPTELFPFEIWLLNNGYEFEVFDYFNLYYPNRSYRGIYDIRKFIWLGFTYLNKSSTPYISHWKGKGYNIYSFPYNIDKNFNLENLKLVENLKPIE